MVDPRVVEYIKTCKLRGYPMSKVRSYLFYKGWEKKEVEEAIAHVEKEEKPKKTEETEKKPEKKKPKKGNDYFSKLISIITDPINTLDTYRKGKGIFYPFRFMFITAMISGLISFISYLVSGTDANDSAMMLITTVFIHIGSVFGLSGLFQSLLRLFGSKIHYSRTFRAFAYVSGYWVIGAIIAGASLFLSYIKFLNLLLGMWMLILLGISLKDYTDMSFNKLIYIWGIVFIFAALLAFFVGPSIISLASP